MDKRSLIILKADVEAQMSLINATMSTLEARVRGLQPDDVHHSVVREHPAAQPRILGSLTSDIRVAMGRKVLCVSLSLAGPALSDPIW